MNPPSKRTTVVSIGVVKRCIRSFESPASPCPFCAVSNSRDLGGQFQLPTVGCRPYCKASGSEFSYRFYEVNLLR